MIFVFVLEYTYIFSKATLTFRVVGEWLHDVVRHVPKLSLIGHMSCTSEIPY